MPVFIIGLLSSFLYQPLIGKMALLWDQRDELLKSMVIKQVFAIASITLLCLLGAWIIGIPILSSLYNTDLHEWKFSLEILLLGGGLYALSSLLAILLILTRHQNIIIWGYGFTAIISRFLSDTIIKQGGIWGASLLYMFSMGAVSLIFCIAYLYFINKDYRKQNI